MSRTTRNHFQTGQGYRKGSRKLWETVWLCTWVSTDPGPSPVVMDDTLSLLPWSTRLFRGLLGCLWATGGRSVRVSRGVRKGGGEKVPRVSFRVVRKRVGFIYGTSPEIYFGWSSSFGIGKSCLGRPTPSPETETPDPSPRIRPFIRWCPVSNIHLEERRSFVWVVLSSVNNTTVIGQ